jgi:PIN domain nuclease of toxin-antitoxin system
MIALDTHALVWWVSGHSRLSEPALTAINKELAAADGVILVSSMSAWEVAMLVEARRLTLTMSVDDWLDNVTEIEGLRFVPVDTDIAVASTRLPEAFHKDPADRIIVALARHFNVPLVTADERILNYKSVKTLW